MGFFAAQCDLLISGLELYVAFFMALVSNFICRLTGCAHRLAEIFELETLCEERLHNPVSAELIKEYLPVVKFGEIVQRFCEVEEEFVCTVCLSAFEEEEEIRELCNCRHLFHRNCLEEWIDHGQSGCPTCRTCLLPDQQPGEEEVKESASVVERIAFLFAQDLISLPN